jgi:hypothetical protein
MAIDYYLHLGTPLAAAEVVGELQDFAQTLSDRPVTPELLLGEGIATKRGTWIHATDTKVPSWSVMPEDFGFTPTVTVSFRQDKFTDTLAQTDDMIRLTSYLLDHVPGDAALHFEFEYIMLLRRDGELSLNERSDIWSPQRLAMVRQSYQRATYKFS